MSRNPRDLSTGPKGDRGYRSQQEKNKSQLLSDLSQGLDVQHHDTYLRHQFGTTFEPPTKTSPNVAGDTNGFVGTSDQVARADHRHGTDDVPWTYIGSFLNGWGNYGGGNAPARSKRVGDIVYLEGVIGGGTLGVAAMTLPIEHRPIYSHNIPSVANAAFAYCYIGTLGQVMINGSNNSWFSFDGVSFSVT